jgi:hypothetical protein
MKSQAKSKSTGTRARLARRSYHCKVSVMDSCRRIETSLRMKNRLKAELQTFAAPAVLGTESRL